MGPRIPLRATAETATRDRPPQSRRHSSHRHSHLWVTLPGLSYLHTSALGYLAHRLLIFLSKHRLNFPRKRDKTPKHAFACRLTGTLIFLPLEFGLVDTFAYSLTVLYGSQRRAATGWTHRCARCDRGGNRCVLRRCRWIGAHRGGKRRLLAAVWKACLHVACPVRRRRRWQIAVNAWSEAPRSSHVFLVDDAIKHGLPKPSARVTENGVERRTWHETQTESNPFANTHSLNSDSGAKLD